MLQNDKDETRSPPSIRVGMNIFIIPTRIGEDVHRLLEARFSVLAVLPTKVAMPK